MALISKDTQLTDIRNSLGNHKTPIFYSSLADNAGGLQEPISGCILIAPVFAKAAPELLRALVARELGRATNKQRIHRWRITVGALCGCLIADIVLINARLPPVPRIIDALVATLLFWVAIWLFRTLQSDTMIARVATEADDWAKAHVPDYDALKIKLATRTHQTS